jgi:SNF2 family DNA or RNA helicase
LRNHIKQDKRPIQETVREAVRKGDIHPFEGDDIVICSYQFARKKAIEINQIRWDLVVIDEAHRLRNVYKPSNVIANTLKEALKDSPKLLLTATPLQNSLLELFGLVSFIDRPYLWGFEELQRAVCLSKPPQYF